MNRIDKRIVVATIISLLVFPGIIFAVTTGEVQDILKNPVKIEAQYPFKDCFQSTANKQKIPVSLLVAVARGESNFNPQAISKKNAVGLMQIRWPLTAKELGFTKKEDLFDGCKNIDAGGRYIKQLLRRYNGDLYRTLAAYNYGPGRITKSGSIPGGADQYVDYIYDKYRSFRPVPVAPGGVVKLELTLKSSEWTTLVLKPYLFNFYYYARNAKNDLSNRAGIKSVTYDVEKNMEGRYQVVASFNKSKINEKKVEELIYEVTGMKVR